MKLPIKVDEHGFIHDADDPSLLLRLLESETMSTSNPLNPSFVPIGYLDDRFIVGYSDNVEAEYSFRSTEPITILTLSSEGEAICVEGFSTKEKALDYLLRENVDNSLIEMLFYRTGEQQ